MGIDERLTGEIVRRVLSVAEPERIILFGSAARGEMTCDSDIELLVLERSPEDARKRSVVVGDALRGLGFPFDVIVMATQRFEETKDLVGGLALPADKGGKVIYEAAWMAHTATSNVSKRSSGTGSPSSSIAAM